MLLREARRQGVQRMVVTHAMNTPIEMTVAQMQEAAKLGAFIEFVGGTMLSADAPAQGGPLRRRDPQDRAGVLHPVERSRAEGNRCRPTASPPSSWRSRREDSAIRISIACRNRIRRNCWGCSEVTHDRPDVERENPSMKSRHSGCFDAGCAALRCAGSACSRSRRT